MLSIVILAHNKIALSRKCLRSIADSNLPFDYEVLFVDNRSDDAADGLIKEFKGDLKRLRYIRNDKNLSFSIANNQSARKAVGDYLLFLNNDVTVGKHAIKTGMDLFAATKSVGVAGVKLLYPDTQKIQHAGITQMLWGYISNFGVGAAPDDPRFNQRKDVFAVTGAMLFIRRSLFERIEGFDEGYQWGYEDADLCLKAREQGERVLYIPETPSLHWESATLKNKRNNSMLKWNYGLFREKWDHILLEKEENYIGNLKEEGIRRVLIYGTGVVARGLMERLSGSGFEIVALTSSFEELWGETIHGLPVCPLPEVGNLRYDKIVVGSQYYFEIENMIAGGRLAGQLLFPAV